MKKSISLMPCLDIRDGRVVKGIHFQEQIDIGDPEGVALAYETAGADALALWDIAATTELKRPAFDVLRRVASAMKIPVMFGGGIRSLSEVEIALEAGAKKISISSAAFRDPAFAAEAVKQFGGKILVAAVHADRNLKLPSKRELILDGGLAPTGMDAIDFAKKMADLGFGSLLPTSKLCEGVRRGYDLDLIRGVSDATTLPTMASGGAGKLIHFLEAVREGHASTLMASAVFHFGTLTVRQVKTYLVGQGVTVHNPPVQKM